MWQIKNDKLKSLKLYKIRNKFLSIWHNVQFLMHFKHFFLVCFAQAVELIEVQGYSNYYTLIDEKLHWKSRVMARKICRAMRTYDKFHEFKVEKVRCQRTFSGGGIFEYTELRVVRSSKKD